MGYGDRREFVDAVAVEAICENLNTSGQPDPDLVIRTSGEQRLSGHRGPTGGVSRRRLLRALRDYSTPHASIPYVPPPIEATGSTLPGWRLNRFSMHWLGASNSKDFMEISCTVIKPL